jgi:hypothetical protein
VTRAARTAATAAAVILFVLLSPTADAASSRSSKLVESTWKIVSASGTQTVTMSGSDPGVYDSFTANVTARWRTTTHRNSLLTFTWPVQKIRPNFPDPANFAILDRVKVELIGSASGVMHVSDTDRRPFSCKANTGKSPENYLPSGGVPITGGALSAGRLAIAALVRPDPQVLFADCTSPLGIPLGPIERIDVNHPTYRPIPITHVRKARKGRKMTLVTQVTEPVMSEAGAQVGKAVSKATLHLRFQDAI